MARTRPKINKRSIRIAAENSLKKPGSKIRKIVDREARKAFREKRDKLLRDFDNHPITKEINAGASSSNSSGTLGGYGNLFSFIGFERGSDPIGSLRRGLQNSIKMHMRPKRIKTAKGMRFEYPVSVPTQRELAPFAPMPWETGNWVERIERGISGLGYYIYQKFSEGSRSGSGKQSRNRIKTGVTYTRTTYLSKILNDFNRSR